MIKKITKYFLLLLISLFLLTIPAKAATYNIANALEVSFDGNAIFYDTNMYPGKSISKTISVRNYGVYSHTFSIATSGVSGVLADVIYIRPYISGLNIFDKNLSSMAVSPFTDNIIANIDPGQTINIDMRAQMLDGLGNEYMNQSLSFFQLYMGNEGSDPVEPDSDGGNTNNNSDNSSGDSTTAGFFDSVAVDFFTTGQDQEITQGVIDEQEQKKPESQENDSNELFSQTNEDNVKGAQTGKCYAWLLLLVLLIFLIIYKIKTYNKKVFLNFIWPLVAGLIIYVIHLFIDDPQSSLFLCKYFLWIEIAILSIYYIVGSFFITDKD